MSKHTALPWHYQEGADAYTHILRGPKGEFIIQGSQDNSGKTEAELRLISKCVNSRDALVASLEKMIDYADTWRSEMQAADYSPLDVDPCIEAIKTAREAIAKAEGKQ